MGLLLSRRNSYSRSSLRRVEGWGTANWIRATRFRKLATSHPICLPSPHRTATVTSTHAPSSPSSSSLFYPPTHSCPLSCHNPPPATPHIQTHTHLSLLSLLSHLPRHQHSHLWRRELGCLYWKLICTVNIMWRKGPYMSVFNSKTTDNRK